VNDLVSLDRGSVDILCFRGWSPWVSENDHICFRGWSSWVSEDGHLVFQWMGKQRL